jgi:hypothetical protein
MSDPSVRPLDENNFPHEDNISNAGPFFIRIEFLTAKTTEGRFVCFH